MSPCRRGAAVWNAWRAEEDEVPDLSRAGLRGLDLTGSIFRGRIFGRRPRERTPDADLSGARLRVNFFKAAKL